MIVSGAELFGIRPAANRWLSRVLGPVLIVTGISVLLLPDITVGLLATVVGA